MADRALRRRPDGTVLPGSSLNPSGRPRIVQEIQELARKHAPAAFARVVGLVDSDDERIALAASQEILNRTFGKPMQSVQSDVRKLDVGQIWVASMQALQNRDAASTAPPTIDVSVASTPPPTIAVPATSTALPIIDVPAAEPALEYLQTQPLSDDDPLDW